MSRTLYHRTPASRAILAGGFVDSVGQFGLFNLGEPVSGVWLSEVPSGTAAGARGEDVLTVELDLSDDDLAAHDVVDEGKGDREWLIPAEVVNRGRVRLLTAEDADQLPPRFSR